MCCSVLVDLVWPGSCAAGCALGWLLIGFAPRSVLMQVCVISRHRVPRSVQSRQSSAGEGTKAETGIGLALACL